MILSVWIFIFNHALSLFKKTIKESHESDGNDDAMHTTRMMSVSHETQSSSSKRLTY